MLIDQTLLSYRLLAIGLVAAGPLVHPLWLAISGAQSTPSRLCMIGLVVVYCR